MRVSRIAHWLHLLCCVVLIGSGAWFYLSACAAERHFLHLLFHICVVLQALAMLPTYNMRGWFKATPPDAPHFWQWPYHYQYNNVAETVWMIGMFMLASAFLFKCMICVHSSPTMDMSDVGPWVILGACSFLLWLPRIAVWSCGYDEVKK